MGKGRRKKTIGCEITMDLITWGCSTLARVWGNAIASWMSESMASVQLPRARRWSFAWDARIVEFPVLVLYNCIRLSCDVDIAISIPVSHSSSCPRTLTRGWPQSRKYDEHERSQQSALAIVATTTVAPFLREFRVTAST